MGEDPGKKIDLPASETPARPSQRRLMGAKGVVGFVVLLLLAASGLWASRHWFRTDTSSVSESMSAKSPQDPRLVYAGPYLNVHPDIAYVGDQSCSGCHREKTLSYQHHPMGRSLLPISRIAARQRYDGKTNNPFEALGVLFQVERRADSVVHRLIGRDDKGQTVYENDYSVDYVLGSGTRGYSYLFDRGGYVFQSPVSWFSQKQIWDSSPGFSVQARSGRPIPGTCLFCHSNRVRPQEGTINRYEEPLFEGHAIGCERCHGPGDLHAKNPGNKMLNEADYTIVNPRHLKPELRAAVCEQCHLDGEARVVRRGRGTFDFRPGLPLEAFWSIYVGASDKKELNKAVNHVEQMYASQCFLQSVEEPEKGKRKLGCTSCHDPHSQVRPEERVAYYRDRCLECHRQRGCSLPEAARRSPTNDDSCIDCHMPRYAPSDIPHTAATDHHIFRRANKWALSATDQSNREAGIMPFYQKGQDTNEKDAERDFGIALAHIMVDRLNQRKSFPIGGGQQAVELLERAARNDPEDMQAQEALAEVLALLNRQAESLTVYQDVLNKAPHREVSLLGAAMLAQSLRQLEPALLYWKLAAAENPWQPYYRASLAKMLADKKAWDEAQIQSEAWVRLDPANVEARTLWVSCLAKTGDLAKARTEFAKIERLRPPNLSVLKARFAVELRNR